MNINTLYFTYAASKMLRCTRWCMLSWICLAGAQHSPAWSAVPSLEIANGPIIDMYGSRNSVAISTPWFAPGSTFIYQSGFDAVRWSGILRKRAVTMAENGMVQIASVPEWDAADLLSGIHGKPPEISPDQRKIYTARIVADSMTSTVEFKWENLTHQQRLFLNSSPVNNNIDGLGARRVAFLRGDRSDEQGRPHGIFRPRAGVLGDIINSNPVYADMPDLRMAGQEYQTFYEAHKHRAKTVYVGANDGMLHAFDANNGMELFAYVPNALIPRLNQLSRPDYAHRPYVDGGLAVAEAQLQGKWKTILAAGMGGGAQGVFALDVTDPAHFSEGAGALWEFTDHDDAEMGNVVTAPVIAKFKTRTGKKGPEYRYFVVVASGMNNYVDDGHFNQAAPAVLFLLAVDKRPVDKWILGKNYFKFEKPNLDAGVANGLSSPGLAIGADGAVRFGYAGDLQGNLWRFDFTGNQPWEKENAATNPLFTATDDKQQNQPITIQPKVVFAPGGGYVVLFGTGKLLELADATPNRFRNQSFYAIYDSTHAAHTVAGRHQLASRTLLQAGSTMQLDGEDFIYGDMPGTKKGWYLDFFESHKSGERVVSNPATASAQVFFNSLIPCVNGCLQGGGRSYALNALTGMPTNAKAAARLTSLGMLSAPVLLEMMTDTGLRNSFGTAIAKRKIAVINAGTGGTRGTSAAGRNNDDHAYLTNDDNAFLTVRVPARRLSWREISNWQELRKVMQQK